MGGGKRLDIELMRIIAAFFVIFVHTGPSGYFLFSTYDPHTIQYWVYLFLSVFCILAVPLFFMITGALMLGREPEPLKRLWTHRVLHIALLLLIWSFFYYLVAVRNGTEVFNIKHFFSRLYDDNWNSAFWFLYLYISLLIFLPILQRFAQSLQTKEYIYWFSVYALFVMLIPCAQFLLFYGKHTLSKNFFYFAYSTSCLFVFSFAGYFWTYRVKDFWNKKRLTILWAISIAVTLLACYLTYLRASITGQIDESNSQVFHTTFVLINASAVFVTCQYLDAHTNILKKASKVITTLGGCTFGVYLLHIYIKDYTRLPVYMRRVFLEQLHIPSMLYAFLLSAVVFVCCCLITFIMKKIPILRRLVS